MYSPDFDQMHKLVVLVESKIVGLDISQKKRVDLIDTAIEICRIAQYGKKSEYWNIENANNTALEFKKTIVKLLEIYYSLPYEIRNCSNEFIEKKYIYENRKYNYDHKILNGKYYIDLSIGQIINDVFDLPIYSEHDPMELSRMNTVVEKAALAIKPKQDVKEKQSQSRIKKYHIINLIRSIWLVSAGQPAPRSVPDGGSAFGDFIAEIFEIVEMNADPRAAVDAWRSMADT